VSIEVLIIPVTYLSVWKLKKAEGLDVFDREIRYNPFKFNK
jgi:hypothetical protein